MGAIENPGLFRLALATMVFLSHTSRVSLGRSAVYVFFALSGFWIFTMWTRRYSRARTPYRIYLVSRTWRLLPTFLLCTAICWTIILAFGVGSEAELLPGQPIHQLFSNLLIFGYATLRFQPIVPAWSLDIEAQFYVIAPLLIALTVRSFWTLAACIAISLIAVSLRSYAYLPTFLGFFAAGVAAGAAQWQPGRTVAWGSFAALISILLACWLSPFRSVAFLGAHPGPYSGYNEAANVVAGIFLIPLAMLTTRRKSGAFDHMLGDISYIFYLLHWRMMKVLDTASGNHWQRAAALFAVFAIILLASWVVWRVFDKPVNRMRERWVSARITAAPA